MRAAGSRLFDVRVEATPANLAYTGLPIALQGCYADLDGVASTLAVLRRKRGKTG